MVSKPERQRVRAFKALVAAAALACSAPAATIADEPTQTIVTTSDVYASFEVARAIYMSAPAFVPGSDLVRRLEAAADHGTTVSVGVASGVAGPAKNATDSATADLALHGIDIQSAPKANAWVALVDDATFITFSPWPQKADATSTARSLQNQAIALEKLLAQFKTNETPNVVVRTMQRPSDVVTPC